MLSNVLEHSNPDVMLEAYFEHPYSPLFFVAYLAITFYYLMNVVSLAIAYNVCKEVMYMR